jgi:hypothetical protein
MSKEHVEQLLTVGGKDKNVRFKYNVIETMEKFVLEANADGYDFTKEELESVLREEGDSFESSGNPRVRSIWWR